ncbi:unnamed protein product [Amoebophrya sp. A25]|nr:unnamed protein product [Amoebophrya sp. A25]|eukprot:GSA25T00019441001.1
MTSSSTPLGEASTTAKFESPFKHWRKIPISLGEEEEEEKQEQQEGEEPSDRAGAKDEVDQGDKSDFDQAANDLELELFYRTLAQRVRSSSPMMNGNGSPSARNKWRKNENHPGSSRKRLLLGLRLPLIHLS